MWFLGIETHRHRAALTLLWAWVGLMVMLLEPAVRLSEVAHTGWVQSSPRPWLGYLIATLTMLYIEGYRGFHRAFSPAFAKRCLELATTQSRLQRLLAPLVAMGLVGVDRKTLRRMWTLTFMIVGFVIVIRQLPQPYRGMVDAGVAAALVMGALSSTWHLLRCLALGTDTH